MRTEKIVQINEKTSPSMISAAMAVVIPMLLSIGFIFMYGTAAELEFSVLKVLLLTFITSLASTVIHFLNRKKLSIGAFISAPVTFILMMIFNWFRVKEGLLAFLYYVKLYAFYWFPGIYDIPEEPDVTVLAFLAAYNLVAACVTSFVLLRRKWIPAALLYYLPLFICSVANIIMRPSQVPCLIAASGVFMLLLTHVLRHKRAATAERALLIVTVPVLSLTLLTAVIFPEKRYGRDEWARDLLTSIQESIEESTSKDSALSRMLDTILNGFTNPEAEGVNSNIFSPLYATRTNLSRVGPFDPPQDRILTVYRKRNTDYSGDISRYNGNILYLKIESLDRYEDNTLSSSSMIKNNSKIYADGYEPDPQSAQYSLTITPLESSGVDVVPYYTDFYSMEDIDPARVSPYNTTHNYVTDYAASPLPVKTGNIYSEWYLDWYVYNTALKVPKATENALTMSGKLPDWYMEVFLGHIEMSDADKVRGVTEFVRNLHPYDENTECPPEDVDFVPWFVSEAESGICVHYAITSVILLRMIGVPARYVRGYVDTRSYDNAESVIYASQAHAWFEFFVPEYGWIMGDSTPGYAQDAANFNIDAVSRVSPEIETASFSKGNYTYEPPETTAETTETEETTETSLNEDGTTPTPTPVPTVPAGQDPSDPSRQTDPNHPELYGIISYSTSDGEESGLTALEKNIIKLFAIVLIAAIAIWLLLMLAKLVFAIYWKKQFKAEKINDRAIACYHYYRFMGRVFGFALPAKADDIAEKAAFSEGGITQKELAMLNKVCAEHMKACSGSFSRIKMSIYRLMEIKIRNQSQV
ncbi:MAG: hypothetical protein IKG01_01130 [Lachnospiraceae bacterium]|nr:hypothetical protein [Lachnospiraceae bacterium]